MENPYNKDTAGTYNFEDYMRWNWKTEGMTLTQTVDAEKDIFSD